MGEAEKNNLLGYTRQLELLSGVKHPTSNTILLFIFPTRRRKKGGIYTQLIYQFKLGDYRRVIFVSVCVPMDGEWQRTIVETDSIFDKYHDIFGR